MILSLQCGSLEASLRISRSMIEAEHSERVTRSTSGQVFKLARYYERSREIQNSSSGSYTGTVPRNFFHAFRLLASPRETGYHRVTDQHRQNIESAIVPRLQELRHERNPFPLCTSRLISTDGCGLAEQFRGTRCQRKHSRGRIKQIRSVRHSHRFLALPSLSYVAITLVFMSYESTRPQRQEMLSCSPSPIPGPRSHRLLLASTVLSSATFGTDMRGSEISPSYR